mgnify:CR=1 FL=1
MTFRFEADHRSVALIDIPVGWEFFNHVFIEGFCSYAIFCKKNNDQCLEKWPYLMFMLLSKRLSCQGNKMIFGFF